MRYFSAWTANLVVVQLAVAHIDHEDLDRFFNDDNLKLLCAACHLRFDVPVHVKHARETRQRTKDGHRPLLAEAA